MFKQCLALLMTSDGNKGLDERNTKSVASHFQLGCCKLEKFWIFNTFWPFQRHLAWGYFWTNYAGNILIHRHWRINCWVFPLNLEVLSSGFSSFMSTMWYVLCQENFQTPQYSVVEFGNCLKRRSCFYHHAKAHYTVSLFDHILVYSNVISWEN